MICASAADDDELRRFRPQLRLQPPPPPRRHLHLLVQCKSPPQLPHQRLRRRVEVSLQSEVSAAFASHFLQRKLHPQLPHQKRESKVSPAFASFFLQLKSYSQLPDKHQRRRVVVSLHRGVAESTEIFCDDDVENESSSRKLHSSWSYSSSFPRSFFPSALSPSISYSSCSPSSLFSPSSRLAQADVQSVFVRQSNCDDDAHRRITSSSLRPSPVSHFGRSERRGRRKNSWWQSSEPRRRRRRRRRATSVEPVLSSSVFVHFPLSCGGVLVQDGESGVASLSVSKLRAVIVLVVFVVIAGVDAADGAAAVLGSSAPERNG